MKRTDLTARQLAELDRIAANTGTVTATKHYERRAEAEWLVMRGLARWDVRDGFVNGLLHITPEGRRVQDAF